MIVKDSTELKGLQVRLQKALGEQATANAELADAQHKAQNAERVVATLQEQIKKFASAEPIVTEHALLRYCERILGVDLDAARKEILAPARLSIIKAMGTGKLDMPDGRKLVFKNRAVITIE